MKNQKVIIMIPARYESTRFPGKPLVPILGKPMVQWVYERATKATGVHAVYIATDDERILKAVEDFGGNALMTGICNCGTERIYQASNDLDYDIVINVQGDEPTIKPEGIEELLIAFEDENVCMATLKQRIEQPEDINNPNVVKVVTDSDGNALYFSRYGIPYNREIEQPSIYYKHIGIYGYRKKFLETFVHLPNSRLEEAENLEQLRVLENGYKIKVLETKYKMVGVDTSDDIIAVERILRQENKKEV